MRLLRLLPQIALGLALLLLVIIGGTARAEADPLLDKALSLEARGEPKAALKALNRLVSAALQNPVYRLALARSLLRQGERERARFHLQQVRAAPGLHSAERAALTRILARLESGKPREGWLRFALIPESNPGQRTSAQSIEITGLSWQLDAASRASAATGLGFGIGGALTPAIAEGLRLRLGASLEGRLYEDDALSDVFLRGEVGLQGLTPGGVNWRGVASAALHHTGGALHGRAFGLQGELSWPLGRASHLRLRAEVEQWRHPRHSGQDGPRGTVSAMLVQAWRPDLVLRSGLFLHRTKARADWEDLRGAGLSFGLHRALNNGLVLGADLALSRLRRGGPAPLFAQVRRERRTSLTLRALHREITVKGFAPMLEMGIDRQRSTVGLYDYRNLRFSLGFTREF